jgi:proline racemase
MRFESSFQAIDTHTVGEPTRIIVSGLPKIPGNSVMEKKEYMVTHLDRVRHVLLFEPRGQKEPFGAFIVPPCMPEADFGVIYSDGGGYLNMCGHGTIGVSTMLVEMGYVEAKEPYTEFNLEAPAGLIKVKVKVTDGRAESVSLQNVPAFVFKRDCEVDLPGVGKVKFDISFGGSFFCLIHASQLKTKIKVENLEHLVPQAMLLRDIINKEYKVQHPTEEINTVDLIEIYDDPVSPGCNGQNVVIFGDKNVDRSPCGTGTSAKLALLHAEGKLGLHQPYVYESIIKTRFTGEILGETKVGDFPAVIPQITGSAYITGINQLLVDPFDPYKHGFMLQ